MLIVMQQNACLIIPIVALALAHIKDMCLLNGKLDLKSTPSHIHHQLQLGQEFFQQKPNYKSSQ